MELQKAFLEMIQSDIKRIDEVLKKGIEKDQWELFREMDGKYQSCIKDFYESMWWSIPGKNILHFPELEKNPDQVEDNLKMVKAKLETYKFQANAIAPREKVGTNVNVVTNIGLNVTFEQARLQVEDMTFLTEEQTKEVLDKISEIEDTLKGYGTKKTKWEKIKPVLVWLADKSFDVGMTLLPLLMKLNN